jgi:retron-type reverse transcriptase
LGEISVAMCLTIFGVDLDLPVNLLSVNNSESRDRTVTSGIPQGSVLDPILFVIYINDVPECVNASTYIFADDTKIYKEISCEDDISGL